MPAGVFALATREPYRPRGDSGPDDYVLGVVRLPVPAHSVDVPLWDAAYGRGMAGHDSQTQRFLSQLNLVPDAVWDELKTRLSGKLCVADCCCCFPCCCDQTSAVAAGVDKLAPWFFSATAGRVSMSLVVEEVTELYQEYGHGPVQSRKRSARLLRFTVPDTAPALHAGMTQVSHGRPAVLVGGEGKPVAVPVLPPGHVLVCPTDMMSPAAGVEGQATLLSGGNTGHSK